MTEKLFCRRGAGATTHRTVVAGAAAALLLACGAVLAQDYRFEDVVANLKHRDAEVRHAAMQLLAEAGYPDAIAPLAILVTDPVDAIQMEAIQTEVALCLGRTAVARKRVAGLFEVRTPGSAQAAFEGDTLTPRRRAPVELVTALATAIGDPDPRVQIEATYAFGALVPPDADLLGRGVAERGLDVLATRLGDADPARRKAATAVIARLFERCGRACAPADHAPLGDALVGALNDPEETVRLLAMRALGRMGYERAVPSLTELFVFYKEGRAAEAALDALARIAHRSSAELFWSLVQHRIASLRRFAVEGIGRLGDRAKAVDLETMTAREGTDTVNAATAFALQRLGRGPVYDRLGALLVQAPTRAQVHGYLIELGPDVVASLSPYLSDSNARVRAIVADVLGRSRNPAAVALVKPLLADPDAEVALAAERAMVRLQGAVKTS
jgi:HEAT repeat protein